MTVIAGAAVIDAEGYDNVMMAIDSDGGNVLYHERMPVPVSIDGVLATGQSAVPRAQRAPEASAAAWAS